MTKSLRLSLVACPVLLAILGGPASAQGAAPEAGAAAPAPVVADPAPATLQPDPVPASSVPADSPSVAATPGAPAATPATATPVTATPVTATPATAAADPAVTPAKPRKKKHAAVAAKVPPVPTTPWSDLPTFDEGSLDRLNALSRFYAGIARQGGFPPAPPANLGPRSSGEAVLALRRRLVIEGDLDKASESEPGWDDALGTALQRFQMRYGLVPAGVMNDRTRAAMAIPVEQRLAQIGRNMERVGARFVEFGRRYVVVNLPGAQVEAIENGKVARHYIAIVGRPENASPQVDATITAVNVNPTWTVPQSIIKKEFVPKLSKDPSYLARQNMKVLDGSGREVDPASVDWSSQKALNYVIRQGSGGGNALGQLRIQMPNPDAVYMHDTPSKKLFGATDRFFSHGCVRVQGVNDLAAWLLGADWTAARIGAEIASGERKDLGMPDHVPVHWVYMTAFVTPDGTAHFRNDVYGLDIASRVAAAQ